MIKTNEISVVVQGAINPVETINSLKSIRQFLPDAEIILSTWEGSNVENLDGLYDILVLNKDPGNTILFNHKRHKLYNNMHRQLLSTQNGIKNATRKYILKLRSDLILANTNFLNYFDKFQARGKNYNLFERKILIPTLYTKVYSERIEDQTPFHFSDWWFFGLKSDIEAYFLDTPLPKEPDFSEYFNIHKDKKSVYSVGFRFAPEQYFGYECFSRNFSDIKMEDASDINDKIIQQYNECLVNNFVVLEFKQSGIYTNKYLQSQYERFDGENYLGLYNNYKYESEYKKICDKNYKIKSKPNIIIDYNFSVEVLKLYKHLFRFAYKKTKLNKKLEELFVSIPLSLLRVVFALLKSLFSKIKI